MSWLSSQWPGLAAGLVLWTVVPFVYGTLRALLRSKRKATCPRCKGHTANTGAVCWTCSQAGAGVVVHLDGLDRDDTIRDKEVEKAMFKARMKDMNRGQR